jgi:hypothetical protein
MRGVHESKEEVGGVLTERKMKTEVDQGQLVVREDGRLLRVKFSDESWVSRGPNKGENGAGKVPTVQRSSAMSEIRRWVVGEVKPELDRRARVLGLGELDFCRARWKYSTGGACFKEL